MKKKDRDDEKHLKREFLRPHLPPNQAKLIKERDLSLTASDLQRRTSSAKLKFTRQSILLSTVSALR